MQLAGGARTPSLFLDSLSTWRLRSLPTGAATVQGKDVRLGNSHAALLEGRGASWAEAVAEGMQWQLVQVLEH